MYYADFYSLFNNLEKDWGNMKFVEEKPPSQIRRLVNKKVISTALIKRLRPLFYLFQFLSDSNKKQRDVSIFEF